MQEFVKKFEPLIVVFLLGVSSTSLTVCAVDRTDPLFIDQLLRRNLFDIADRFCETRRARSLNVDEASEWSRQLANIAAQRAWFQDSSGRNELLNEQIDRLETMFNGVAPLSARARLRTRFAQIKLILSGLRIQLLMQQAGHLGRHQSGHDGLLRKSDGQKDGSLASSDETIELLDQLLIEVDRDRKELGHSAADLRDQGRLLKANLHYVRSSLSLQDSKFADTERNVAMATANAVVRATREASAKQEAYFVLAACLSDAGAIAEFESHVRRLETLYPIAAEKPHKLLLVVSLLRQQNVDGALLELSDYQPTTSTGLQRVAWLKLEASLIRFEVAAELEDSKLIAAAEEAFRSAATTALRQTSGAYREAVQRVMARFELSNSVGIEVADLVEQVSAHRERKENFTALSLIEAARQRLAPDAFRAKAALDLTAGEILISESGFVRAQERLASAVEGFAKSNDRAREAAADLLRIYAFAQTLSESLEAADKQAYARELRKHLLAFPESISGRTARKWLITLLGRDEPLECFKLLQQELSDQTEAEGTAEVLKQMALVLPATSSDADLSEAQKTFRKLLADVRHSPDAETDSDGVLQFFELEYAANDDSPVWPAIYQKLAASSDTLPGDLQQLDPSGHLHSRFLVLFTVTTARTNGAAEVRQSIRNKILAFNGDAFWAAQHIATFMDEATMKGGDQWLAGVVDELIRKHARTETVSSRLMSLLRLATAASRMTGRNDVLDEMLQKLTSQELTAKESMEIANILSQGRTLSETGTSRAFWRRIADTNVQGSALWLEATVQLAELAISSGKKAAARKRLGVANTLYPDWGSDDRRQRAMQLLQQSQM